MESGQHTENRIIATTGLLSQQDYCMVHQGTWRARVESGQHTDNRIIATTGLLNCTPGDRGEPGWSLGNIPTTGLLPQQDYCMVHWGPGGARVEFGQHTNNGIIATIGLLYDSQG